MLATFVLFYCNNYTVMYMHIIYYVSASYIHTVKQTWKVK